VHEEVRPGEDELLLALHRAALLHLHDLFHCKGHHTRNTLELHASTKFVSNLRKGLCTSEAASAVEKASAYVSRKHVRMPTCSREGKGEAAPGRRRCRDK
jgi:hypothetical protein